MSEVTRILHDIREGVPGAADALMPLLYDELRAIATRKLAGEAPGNTLQPTALVHEVWLRLMGDRAPAFDASGHFFAAAAEAMRRILIDRAREKRALKRGGGAERVSLGDLEIAIEADDETLLVVDEAMAKLAVNDPAAAEFIKLRFFGGLTNLEAAQALGIPERTARRHWSYARAWLLREIRRDQAVSGER